MRVLIDENLPAALARALNELSLHREQVPVTHLTQRFDRGTVDVDWIHTLGEEGDWVIVSQDRFRKSKLEKEALQRSGIAAFVLERAWTNHAFWEKAQNLVRWWPVILQRARSCSGSTVHLVPWRISGNGTFKAI
ncbi:hypothetical protein [Arhodomonas sp. AD133]|uniref:PIN-like domain-containing protein n=1 Tax=Arhodomonas sp. AD133 TaxID=3415009 RepID=UPI003EBC0E4A